MTRLLLADFDLDRLLKASRWWWSGLPASVGPSAAEIAEAVRLVEDRPRGQTIRAVLNLLVDAAGGTARLGPGLKALQAALTGVGIRAADEGAQTPPIAVDAPCRFVIIR